MGKRDFKRKPESRRQNPRFLIVSEGEVTEREYLTAVMKLRNIRSADIVIAPPPPTSPKQIVEKARKLKMEARKEDGYDAVWCIFDVEAKVNQNSRPGLAEAIQRAKANKIHIALSNPCFELWILLYEKQHTAAIYSNNVQDECSRLRLLEGKHVCNPDLLLNNCQIACHRAEGLDSMHHANGTHNYEDQNPSSGVYKLMEAIHQAFRPRE